jgi:hypothetical protein
MEAQPNTHHILVCALTGVGSLLKSLGTEAVVLLSDGGPAAANATGAAKASVLDSICATLLHPSASARLAAAWCLRALAVALPSQRTPFILKCAEQLDALRSAPEAVSGYSAALAALLGSVPQAESQGAAGGRLGSLEGEGLGSPLLSPSGGNLAGMSRTSTNGRGLGIPRSRGKQIFQIAEELLRTASQNSRLSLQRTQSGWLLLGALMTLGAPVVKPHLPRLLLLWKNAFPRSNKELEAEKVNFKIKQIVESMQSTDL